MLHMALRVHTRRRLSLPGEGGDSVGSPGNNVWVGSENQLWQP